MIETYKILHNLYDHNCSNLLKLPSSFYVRETRGRKLKLYHEHSRLKKRKHSLPNRVVSLWNSLPEKVALAPTLINLIVSMTAISVTARNYTTLMSSYKLDHIISPICLMFPTPIFFSEHRGLPRLRSVSILKTT